MDGLSRGLRGGRWFVAMLYSAGLVGRDVCYRLLCCNDWKRVRGNKGMFLGIP